MGKNLGLSQTIDDPTRYTHTGASLIDHIFTDTNHISHSATVNYNITDHLPIVLVKKKSMNNILFKEIVGRSYRDFDLTSFLNDIRTVEFATMVNSNEVWNNFIAHISSAIDYHCPIRTMGVPCEKPDF